MAGKFDQVGVELLARDRSRAGVDSFARNMRTVETVTRNVSRLLGGLGIGVGVGALGYGLRDAAREAMRFETQIARVHTMLDDGSSRFLPMYERQIQGLAKTYGESTESLAGGMYDILSASIAPEKALGVLEKTLIAAKGGFTSAATATNATVGILNAYNMSADEAGRVTDILHAIVKRGVISFEDLAQNIGNVTSLAAVLGVDLETVGATIATMTRAGISAELAITALKNILNTFKDPSDEARKAAAELGLTLDENSIKGRGLITVMNKLRNANAQQLGALMPSIRGLVGFAAQLKNADQLGRDYQLMLDSTGRSQEAFNKIIETAGFRADKLTERWKAAKRELGGPIAEMAISSMELLADALDRAKKANDAFNRSAEPWSNGTRLSERLQSLSTEQRRSLTKAMPGADLRGATIYDPYRGFQTIPGQQTDNSEYVARLVAAYERSAGIQARLKKAAAAQMSAQQAGNTEGARMLGPEYWDKGTPIDWDQQYKMVTEWTRKWAQEEKQAAREVERAKEAVTRLDQQLDTSIEVTARMADGHAYAADQVAYEQAVWQAYGDDVDTATRLIEQHTEKLRTLENEQKKVATSPLLTWTDVARQSLDDLSGTLTDIAFDFRNAGQHAERFVEQLARLAVQELIMRPLVQGIGGALGLTQNARGNVYGPGGIELFGRGDIVTRPTLFRFAGGTGLMGEAGEEAILPLGRNARGELGVKAETAPAQRVTMPKVSLVINNQAGTPIAAEDVTTTMTPDEYVISILLRDHAQGGRTRDLMRRRS